MGRRALAASLAPAAMLLVAGCGSDSTSPTDDEAAVCGAVQDVVDQVLSGAGDNAQASENAVAALASLQDAVVATSNPEMHESGNAMFVAITGLTDPGQYTVEETAEVGRQVGVAAAQALDELVVSCAEVGAPIERLDQVPVDQEMVDIVGQYGTTVPVTTSAG